MRLVLACFAILCASPLPALTADEIDAAAYAGGTLPDGQSGLTVKVQVLLDRAGISPGIIDGYKGGMSESALRGFEERSGLFVDGVLDPQVWQLLGGAVSGPITMIYRITSEDAAGLVPAIPNSVAEKAQMEALAHTSVAERLAERLHMDEDFLRMLNPGAAFVTGETITVVDPGYRMEAPVARIEIRKGQRRAATFDRAGRMISNYPVAIGSDETPSPSGNVTVNAVAFDPTYTYDPDLNFEADGVKETLILPPGPNGPVGSVWIDLSKPTYGLHGTPSPATLFRAQSHRCVRFTNWDVEELANMVDEGVTVEFVE